MGSNIHNNSFYEEMRRMAYKRVITTYHGRQAYTRACQIVQTLETGGAGHTRRSHS